MQKWSEMIGLKTKFDTTRNYEVPSYTQRNYDSYIDACEYEERAICVPKYGFQIFHMERSDYPSREGVHDNQNTDCIYLNHLLKYVQQYNMEKYFHIPKKFNFTLPHNLLDRYAYEWMKLNVDSECTNASIMNILMSKMNKIMEQEV